MRPAWASVSRRVLAELTEKARAETAELYAPPDDVEAAQVRAVDAEVVGDGLVEDVAGDGVEAHLLVDLRVDVLERPSRASEPPPFRTAQH